MPLAITIGAGVVLALFALAGALRDLPRGILVLTGVLLGAALVSFWAAPLAADLAQRLGNPDRALLRRITSALLFGIATLLGFGSGLLLPRIDGSTLATRLGGMVLGLFSGALALGYVLRYLSEENPGFLADVRASYIGGPLHDQLPFVLTGAAALIGVAVIGIFAARLFRRPPPAAATQAATNPEAAAPLPAPEQRSAAQKSALDKINTRIKP